MRRRHLRSVVRIEAQVYPRPWSHSLFVSELALRSTRAYFVAKAGRDVVGYAGVMMSLTDGHVTTIAVDPARHRQGVGTRLLLALAREAIARDATALTLEVRLSNRGAQEMYKRFGFRPVGVRKGYYADTGEDALVMWAYGVREPAYAQLLDALERRLSPVRILGIETSCDETAAAVVDDGRVGPVVGRGEPGRPARPLRRRRARGREPGARRADRRRDRGGAGRGRDARWPTSTRSRPCTARGSRARCIVGVSAAKAIALATGIPYVGVHHHEAHVYAALLEDPTLEPPLVTLVVSGGHTLLIAMDDARRRTACSARPSTTPRARRSTRSRAFSGSAIRAVPRSTGSPATAIRRRSRSRGRCSTDGYDFSFSGLKTAVVHYVRKHPDVAVADVAASFQAAVVDVLVEKLLGAAREDGMRHGRRRRRRRRQLGAARAHAEAVAAAGELAGGAARASSCAPTTRRWSRRSPPSAWPPTARPRSTPGSRRTCVCRSVRPAWYR